MSRLGAHIFAGAAIALQIDRTVVLSRLTPKEHEVAPGGPADLAGLEPGDVIETLNGRRVESHLDAILIINAMRPGDLLDIEFSRRMNVTTQASLVRQPADIPRQIKTDSRGVYPRRITTEEQLPIPTYRNDRLEPAASPYEVDRDQYRVEQVPRNDFYGDGRVIDREPERRSRALLPWRRRGY